MALGSLLLLLGLLLLVGLVVAQPLLRLDGESDMPDPDLSHWIAERERVLDALAELDADQAMGKIPAELYASQRAELLADGAGALQQLEKHSQPAATAAPQKDKDSLEALIKTHKAKRKQAARGAK